MAKIISFFSFKGGCGRSLTLCNIAFRLAQLGYKVGCVELDIEAPGILKILDIREKPRFSTIDLLLDPKPANISDSIIRLRKGGEIELPNDILILPAYLEENLQKLEQIQWTRDRLTSFSEDILNIFGEMYELEYIFLDSRSGISNPSIMAILLANAAVVQFCRLDRQSTVGITKSYNLFSKHIPDLTQLIIANFVPEVQKAKKILKELETNLGRRLDATIPYDGDLAIEEEIVFWNRNENDNLCKAYSTVAQKILEV